VGSLIDTGIFIDAERGRVDLPGILSEFADGPAEIASVTAAELLHGANRADAAHQTKRREVVEGYLGSFRVVPLDLPVARTYGTLLAERSRIGRPIGAHDLIIAATALTLGYRVITRDARSFPDIPSLHVVLR
jgi:predicted nucleic acid-binding protein